MRRRAICESLSVVALAATATATATAGSNPVIGYAELDLEYVRVHHDGTTEPVGPLSNVFSVGAFSYNDTGREYAIDGSSGDLYAIDASTAETTFIGATGIPLASGMASIHGVMTVIGNDPTACATTTIYTVSLTEGTATAVGSQDGCLQALVVDPADNRAFSIDVADDSFVEIGTGEIGPLGFNVDDVTELFFDGTGTLFMVALDASAGSAALYAIDLQTGWASLVSPESGFDALTAFAPIPLVSDDIFGSGFDS